VNGVLLAETAILAHFKTVRVVLLVFHGVVVALFALCARHCDSDSHIFPPDSIDGSLPYQAVRLRPHLNLSPSPDRQHKKKPLRRGKFILTHSFLFVNTFFDFFELLFNIFILYLYRIANQESM
jgi:hypothetical protein